MLNLQVYICLSLSVALNLMCELLGETNGEDIAREGAEECLELLDRAARCSRCYIATHHFNVDTRVFYEFLWLRLSLVGPGTKSSRVPELREKGIFVL